MLHLELNLPLYIQALAQLFQSVRFNNKYALTSRGIFNPEHNIVNYGLGDKFWLRYVTAEVDLIVYTSIRSYGGTARVSFKDKELVTQFAVNLNFDNADYVTSDVVEWFRRRVESTQNDWFCANTHDETVQMFEATERPKLYMNTTDPKPQAQAQAQTVCEEDDFEETESRQSDLAVSMQFRSQGDGYCLMVFLVSSDRRNDRYAIVVKSPSMFLNHLTLAYQRGFFGKFMQAITKEHNSKAEHSHLMCFRKMSRARTQAVCVSLPQSQDGIVDTSFRIGFVYDVISRSTNIAGDEYLCLRVDDTDLERHARHFVVFN